MRFQASNVIAPCRNQKVDSAWVVHMVDPNVVWAYYISVKQSLSVLVKWSIFAPCRNQLCGKHLVLNHGGFMEYPIY